MLRARQVFQAKYGHGDDGRPLPGIQHTHAGGGRGRTPLPHPDRCHGSVLHRRHRDRGGELCRLGGRVHAAMGRPWMGEWFSRMMPLVESGRSASSTTSSNSCLADRIGGLPSAGDCRNCQRPLIGFSSESNGRPVGTLGSGSSPRRSRSSTLRSISSKTLGMNSTRPVGPPYAHRPGAEAGSSGVSGTMRMTAYTTGSVPSLRISPPMVGFRTNPSPGLSWVSSPP